MRRSVFLSAVFVATAFALHAQAQVRTEVLTCEDGSYPSNWGVEIRFKITLSDWHQVKEQSALMSALDAGAQASLNQCSGTLAGKRITRISGDVFAPNSGVMYGQIATFRRSGPTGSWEPYMNEIPGLIQQEQRQAELKRQQEIEEAKKKADAEANEKRKQAALAGCAGGPNLSGGPWFSSTYSVAARDETRRGNFFCVKTVEYISAAPNPFGGNAARARFTGYRNSDFQPVVEVRDFAY